MRALIICLLLFSCSRKDYIQVELHQLVLIKKEVYSRYPDDKLGQYWQGRDGIYFQMLEPGDTGFRIGTRVPVFKPK